jgi:phosphoribosyl 1,2-cyclic phosphodiesterase
MRLKVLGSGSSGNCYLLENEKECLIIEAGVHLQQLKIALDFDTSKIVGCIISHEHNDHAKQVPNLQALGINCFMSAGTATKADKATIHNSRTHIIENEKTFRLGGFVIKPFDILHDAVEPLGFLIYHKDCGKVLFITDSKYSKNTFTGLNNIIIEANYSSEIINRKLTAENNKLFLRNRILDSHLSIENCIELLKSNDLSQINNIILIHLSDSNSNEADFVKQIEDLTAKTVLSANQGMDIPFCKSPF